MARAIGRTALIVLACLIVAVPSVAQGTRQKKSAPATAPASTKVDLNTASQKELEDLPGVGPATAKKIIVGRPYASAADLAKAGVPKSTIEKITPLVTVSASAAAESRRASAPPAPPSFGDATTKVDLNTASEKELEALPSVGPVTARKIIAGRPYASATDLAKAGVPGATIQKMLPLVTVSAAPAPRTPPAQVPSTAGTGQPAPSSAATPRPTAPSAQGQQPPSPGMVWVNLDTKIYHRQGDRYYGNTKHGQWMTEADAIAAGYRASKTGPKK